MLSLPVEIDRETPFDYTAGYNYLFVVFSF